MNAFDIIGPVMIGPSSSHTAGAARIGLVARQLLEEEPSHADITLYGSFAKTYRGHGTDRAIIGGLLGFEPSDERIRDSFLHAGQLGLSFRFMTDESDEYHPNTAKLTLTGKQGGGIELTASSIGGGAISVMEINQVGVSFSAQYFTTVIFNKDMPGVAADVTRALADNQINIAFMRLFRKDADAIMVLETDQEVSSELRPVMQSIRHIEKVLMIKPFTK